MISFASRARVSRSFLIENRSPVRRLEKFGILVPVKIWCRIAAAILGAIVAVGCGEACAALAPRDAHTSARRWVAAHPRPFGRKCGRPSGEVLTAAFGGTNLFHAVNFSGGGFAVFDASGDGAAPLAFSTGGEFCETNAAPLWTMLLADTGVRSARRKSRPLLCADGKSPTLPDGVSVSRTTVSTSARLLSTAIETEAGLDDLRVAPLVQSKWNQSTVGSKNVYNYYTPGNVVCGCIATAMAQVMRYHEYPTGSVEARTHACTYLSFGTITNLTMQGGTYDWSLMPLAPDSSISDEERMAIGKLTSDAGISVHMNYDIPGYGSAAFGIAAESAFTNIWQYAQAQYWENNEYDETDDEGTLAAEVMENAILANLDAGYPVLLGVRDSGTGGHETVVDGYGYADETRYIHINLGWSGSEDYWYCFPISTTSYTFSYVADLVYNIFPRETGNIVSGRVTDANGDPVPGVMVRWSGCISETDESVSGTAKTSEYGVYAFIVPNTSVSNINISVAGFETAQTNTTSTSTSCSRSYSEADLASDPSGGSLPYPFNGTQTVGNSWGNDLTLDAQYIAPAFSSTPALSATDGSLTLATTATLGSMWILQWNDDLADDTGWTDLRSFTATGGVQYFTISSTEVDWASTPKAFFRLVSDE